MTECDANSAHPSTYNSDNSKGGDCNVDETPRNGLCNTHHDISYFDSSSQPLIMNSVDPIETSQPRPECLVLVDDLIKKLQPHPRAEIHRHQVFEYVKKIIERSVQEISEVSDASLQQQQESSSVPAPAEVHVCRFG
jgi:hypothetical protein